MIDEWARRSVLDDSNEHCEKLLIRRLTKLICCDVGVAGTNSLPAPAFLLPADFFPTKEHGFKQVRKFAPDRLAKFNRLLGGDR